MISHPRITALYKNKGKAIKEDIASIALARSYVTFENSAKEMNKLKLQERQDVALGFPQTGFFLHFITCSAGLGAHSNLIFSPSQGVFVSVVLSVRYSFELSSRSKKEKSDILSQKMTLDMPIGCKWFETSPPSMEPVTSKRKPIKCSRGSKRVPSPWHSLSQVPNFQDTTPL
jgi:hypothetical protein